jgi:hypothetical protein
LIEWTHRDARRDLAPLRACRQALRMHALRKALAHAASALLLASVASGLAGCRHKTVPLVPQVSLAPIDLEVPPEPEHPPMIQPPPDTAIVAPALPPAQMPRKPAAKKKVTPSKETPPVQVAGAGPAALAIGALSSGGDSTPQSQQQTRDLIASIHKRLTALPAKMASQQRAQVSQVTRFLRQSQQALDTGDAEGAKNLATKAKLLMDDLEKK